MRYCSTFLRGMNFRGGLEAAGGVLWVLLMCTVALRVPWRQHKLKKRRKLLRMKSQAKQN